MTLLSVKNLNKKYNDREILKDVSFDLPCNGLVCITGESGSGKSTLMKCILGIVKLDSGQIVFNGKTIKNFEDFRNKYTSYVFQNYSLISFLNPRENIDAVIRKSEDYKDIEEIAKSVNIQHKLDQTNDTLSGGEKQRVAIGRALARNSKIIFCDEPTGSLDYSNGITIMNLLKELSKSVLVIVVTHNQEHVKRYSDITIDINNGKVNIKQIKKNSNNIKIDEEKKNMISFIRRLKLSLKVLLKSKRKVILALISFAFSFAFFLLSFSSYVYVNKTIEDNKTHFLDFNMAKLSIQTKTNLENSNFSLVKNDKPTYSELSYISQEIKNAEIKYDITPAIGTYPHILKNKNDEKYISKIEFEPYSRKMEKIMLPYLNGTYPSSFNEMIANKQAIDILLTTNFYLDLSNDIDYLTNQNVTISDSFFSEPNIKIVGIIEEFSLLSSPKIYYCYDELETYTKNIRIDNLSNYFGKEVTLYDRLTQYTYENDSFASSHYLLEINNVDEVFKIYKNINQISINNTSFCLENASIEMVNAFNDIFNMIYQTLIIFISITIIISMLLLSLCLSSIVNDLKKDIGIMMCNGILKNDLKSIFSICSLLIGIISSLFSLIVYFIISKLLNNYFLYQIEIVSIPEKISMNMFFLLLLLVSTISLICVLFSFRKIDRLEISEIMREE